MTARICRGGSPGMVPISGVNPLATSIMNATCAEGGRECESVGIILGQWAILHITAGKCNMHECSPDHYLPGWLVPAEKRVCVIVVGSCDGCTDPCCTDPVTVFPMTVLRAEAPRHCSFYGRGPRKGLCA